MLLHGGRPFTVKTASACLTKESKIILMRCRGVETGWKNRRYVHRDIEKKAKTERRKTYPSSKLNLRLSLNHIITLFIKVIFTEAIHRTQSGLQPSQWLQLLHIHTVTEAIHRGQRQKMEWLRQFCSNHCLHWGGLEYWSYYTETIENSLTVQS